MKKYKRYKFELIDDLEMGEGGFLQLVNEFAYNILVRINFKIKCFIIIIFKIFGKFT